MINRFYLKNHLSFKNINIECDKGLIVFTGPSGAGKSVLMNSILSLFGNGNSKPEVSEVEINNLNINSESFDISSKEEFTIKQRTKSSSKFYINEQSVNKKNLKDFSKRFSKHLHLKDFSDFENHNILDFIDFIISKNSKSFDKLKKTYLDSFNNLKNSKKTLNEINRKESNQDELIDFISFELDKINKLDPKENELEELKKIKDSLSKQDKINEEIEKNSITLEALPKLSKLFALFNEEDITNSIEEIYNKGIDCINSFDQQMEAYNDLDIGDLLDRINNINSLVKKHGSISGILEYKNLKEEELKALKNISFEKEELEVQIQQLETNCLKLANQISLKRQGVLPEVLKNINYFLKLLYLEDLDIVLEKSELSSSGIDQSSLFINATNINNISSGEFNRLRLALLTARSKYECENGGILFLDEIDANLSGKESESIAKVLIDLSKTYQIFTISHQPQLSSVANQHFLVEKHDNISTIKKLSEDERVNEISRMISGEDITNEAIEFAKNLLKKEK